MRKYIFIGFFGILVLAGIALAGYFLFCLKEKDWSVFIFSALSALIGSSGLIWQMSKKDATKPVTNKRVGGITVSGNETNLTNATIAGKNVIQKTEIHHHYPSSSATPSPVSPTSPVSSPLFLLPNKNPHFTGRKEILENISKTFNSNEAIAITQTLTGLGGIGKTQIALAYAHQSKKEKKYDYILWIRAETDASLRSSFEDFALDAGMFGKDDKYEVKEFIKLFHRWLQQKDNWLLVFDNAEQLMMLKPWLPPQDEDKNQHVLITSRNNNEWDTLANVIRIDIFTKEEARDFLTHRTKLPYNTFQDELAKSLGYLVLALEQAAAYMNAQKCEYKSYLELLQESNLEEMLKKYPDQITQQSVYTTWNISFNKITNEASKQLLRLFAFFAPENIDKQWFVEASDGFPNELETLKNATKIKLQYGEAIAELTKYSLVTLNEDGSISIHRLVQEVIKANLKEEQSLWRGYALQILNKIKFFEFHTAELRKRFLQLVPHIEAVTKEIIENKETGNLFHFLGWGFKELANYKLALDYYKKALSIFEKVLSKEHPDTATTYNNMAAVYDNQGDYGKALEYYGKSLDIKENVLGKEHPSTAATYDNIGQVYNNQGDYDMALEYYGKSLNIKENVLGTEHPSTATTYNNMALVYNKQGDYNKALEYYRKTLSIFEKGFGKEHPSTATTYNNMALVYNKQGDYDKALEYYWKALSIDEKILGKEHPSTATTYNNMALVYDNQGNYSKALEYHEKALSIREKVLGKEHPSTATTYNNMAFVYREQKKYDIALDYFVKSLIIRKKVLGDEHPSTKSTFESLEDTYKESGNGEPFEAWRKRTVGW